MGVLTLDAGRAYGTDTQGVIFDGEYGLGPDVAASISVLTTTLNQMARSATNTRPAAVSAMPRALRSSSFTPTSKGPSRHATPLGVLTG